MKKIILLCCMCIIIRAELLAQGRDTMQQKFVRFSGTVNSKAFTDQNVGVYVFNQIFGERKNFTRFESPFNGLMIVQLRAGKLKTRSNNTEVKRNEGDIWSIPAHQSMQFMTDDDAVTMQVIIIKEDSLKSMQAKVPAGKKDSAGTVNYSSYNTNILKRSTYRSNVQSSYVVEIWDMIAAAGKKTGRFNLPGVAIAEVRSGSGVFTVDGKSSEVKTGSTLQIPEGSAIEISAKNDPISFRVITITVNK